MCIHAVLLTACVQPVTCTRNAHPLQKSAVVLEQEAVVLQQVLLIREVASAMSVRCVCEAISHRADS